jgi:Lrp/AsnC family leucine-responsive transcriptional regulator
MNDLDPIDRKLLDLLQANGRTPYAELAKAVGLAVSSVNERVRKLSERGSISGVHAAVDPAAVRLDLLAFIFVSWNEPSVEPRFLARIAGERVVMEAHHVTGPWNYLMKVRVTTTQMLEAFLANVVKAVPGVQRTETLIALSSFKESAALPLDPPDWFQPKQPLKI